MKPSLSDLLQRAARVHPDQTRRLQDSVTNPRPGFVDRVLHRWHHPDATPQAPLLILERAARWALLLATVLLLTLWSLPENPRALAQEAAADAWLDMPANDPDWNHL